MFIYNTDVHDFNFNTALCKWATKNSKKCFAAINKFGGVVHTTTALGVSYS